MMIGIVAVIIILLVVGFLVMQRRRGQSTDTTTLSHHRPKTLAEIQREAETQRQAAESTSSVSPTNSNHQASINQAITTATQAIDQHNYPAAIRTLEQAVQSHPNDTNLALTLLNTYALAKANDSFQRFYPTVISLNDAATTLQAKNLKEILEQELASVPQANVTTPSVAPIPSVVTQPLEVPTPVVTAMPVSSFVENPVVPQPQPVVISTLAPEDTIDFEFVDAEPKAPQQPVSTKLNNIDYTLTVPAPVNSYANDVNLVESTSAVTLQDNINQPLHKTLSSKDTDLSLALPTIDTYELNATTEPNIDTLHNTSTIDFTDSLAAQSAPIHPTVLPNISAPTVNNSQATELTFEDIEFDFEDALKEVMATPEAGQPTIDTKAATNTPIEFDFTDELLVPTPTKAEPLTSTSEDTLNQPVIDDSVAPLEEPKTKVTTPTTPTLDFNFDLETPTPTKEPSLLIDDNFVLPDDIAEFDTVASPSSSAPVEPEIITNADLDQPASFSTASSPADLRQQFDFINHLDANQLNLALAEQYISLGEYDSAKRLVDEIDVNSQTQLADKVTQLLQKIG